MPGDATANDRWVPGRSTRAVAVLIGAGLRGRRRAGLAVTFAVLFLSAFGLCAGLVVTGGGAKPVDRLAAQANVAKVVLWQSQADNAAHGPLPGLAAQPGVRTVVGPLVTDDIQFTVAGHTADGQVTALNNPDVPVNRPTRLRGRWVSGPSDLVLERSLAENLHLRLGQTLALDGAGGPTTYTVVGLANDLTDCAYPQCSPGRMFATTAGTARLGPPGGPTYWLDTTGDPNVVAGALQAHYGSRIAGSDTWTDSDTRGDVLRVGQIFGRFVSVFGAFLLVACAVVVAGSMAARLVERRRELALFGAVGFTRGQVVTALVGEELVVGAVATLGGWAVSGLVAPDLSPTGSPYGHPPATWPLSALIVTLLIVGLVLLASTGLGAWRAGRRPITELLRDAPPAGPRGLLGRLTGRVPRRLPVLGVGAAVSRPARAALATLAVVVAVVGTVVATGFIATTDAATSKPAATGDPWNVTVSPAASSAAAAARVQSVLRAQPGVVSWYTESDRPAALAGQTFRSRALGGSPPRYLLGAGRLPTGPGEAIVGYGLLRKFHLTVGDRRTVQIDGRPVALTIVGWYRDTEDTGTILAWRLADLRTLEPGAEPGSYQVTASAGESANALAAALSARLGPSAQVQPFQANASETAGFKAAILLIAVLLGIVGLANLLSALLVSSAESARTVGVSQALGFTPGQLVGQGAIGASVLGLVAVVVGLPLGLVLYDRLSDVVTSGIGIGPGFGAMPSPLGLVGLVVGAPVLCAGLGAIAARRIVRQPVSDVLRWE